MNSIRIRKSISNLAGLFVAAVFLAGGGLKLADPARFAADIGNYRIVSPFLAAILAVYLPWLEIAMGGGLLLARWRRAASLSGLCLLGVFSLALGSAWVRGIDLRCGCFGGGGMSAGWALVRNALLAGLLLWFRGGDSRSSAKAPVQ